MLLSSYMCSDITEVIIEQFLYIWNSVIRVNYAKLVFISAIILPLSTKLQEHKQHISSLFLLFMTGDGAVTFSQLLGLVRTLCFHEEVWFNSMKHKSNSDFVRQELAATRVEEGTQKKANKTSEVFWNKSWKTSVCWGVHTRYKCFVPLSRLNKWFCLIWLVIIQIVNDIDKQFIY